jgi:hypothetical protein
MDATFSCKVHSSSVDIDPKSTFPMTEPVLKVCQSANQTQIDRYSSLQNVILFMSQTLHCDKIAF